jgi:hypothetical protein
VNFVGHAAVAVWDEDDPRYSVGAMLPDLWRMAGERGAPTVHDDVVRRGVQCHHRVDAVFHDTAAFLELSSRLRHRLRAADVTRPATLATAHVGVELLLDGALLRRPTVQRHWARTVAAANTLPAAAIAWRDAAPTRRFAELCANLSRIAEGYHDAAGVTERVVRMLARRPRLRAADSDLPGISAALAALAPDVEASTDALLAEVRTGLEARA